VLLEGGWTVRGGCRDPDQAKSWCNIKDLSSVPPLPDQKLELHPLSFPADGSPLQESLLDPLLADQGERKVAAVFLCVGHEKQEPSTVDFMVNAALVTLKVVRRMQAARQTGAEKIVVVMTSSTGSTNLPGAEAAWRKVETEAWSDPVKQQAAGKHSPAAKTLMEQQSLQYVGRDLRNQVVDYEADQGSPRLCILNPSLILAPALKPGGTSQALPWFGRIVRGEAMSAEVPNDSMSIIHCEDLARLHVACLENKEACGRYFGVVQSWTWKDILECIKKIRGDKYTMHPVKFTDPAPVTSFDFTRRDSLLKGAYGDQCGLRGLEEILRDTITWMETLGQV
jgi:nucleoside-diphosphate-sugar epimerase